MNYFSPGVYVEEVSTGARPIQAVGTSTAGFVGRAPNSSAHRHELKAINNWSEFKRLFVTDRDASTHLSHAVYGFFRNGGSRCYVVNIGGDKTLGAKGKGVHLLEQIDEIAIVAAPGFTDPASYDAVLGHCTELGDRVAIFDAPETVASIDTLTSVGRSGGGGGGGAGEESAADTKAVGPPRSDRGFAALYFPWILVEDPLDPTSQVAVPPSGHMAGVWARVDAMRGVHKAPANEGILGALDVNYNVTRGEQDILNPAGVNCLRYFPTEGLRVWGARTTAPKGNEWTYVNVRRLFNMIEESIQESTRWVVFEPNDESLWKSIRRDIGAFLTSLWRQGALKGTTPEEAFFVKCDAETNPPEEIDLGRVTAVVGIAPVKPAEFVIFRIGQGGPPPTEASEE